MDRVKTNAAVYSAKYNAMFFFKSGEYTALKDG